MYFFQDLPLYQCMLFAVIFAWLKMTAVCQTPFGDDEYFDIDLKKELEMNIWIASVSLEP